MTDVEFDCKLTELDRLLNDPEVSLEPARVWSLLAEVSAHEQVHTTRAAGRRRYG